MSTISTGANIQNCLQRLNNGGVKVVGYDLGDKISLAHAAQQLEAGVQVPVRFANAEASVKKCNEYNKPVDEVVRPTDALTETMQTFKANQEQLRRMAAVVSRCDSELSEQERELKSSLSKLIGNGATFSVERFTYHQPIIASRRFLPGERKVTSNVFETVKVSKKDDDAGLALLMHQLTIPRPNYDGPRQLYLHSGATRHPVATADELIAIARNVQG